MGTAIAVVAGATGLVGQELVRQLAADGAWREVRALVRRPLSPVLSKPNIVAIQVDYAALEPSPQWTAADHVFCALGTTIGKAGSQAAFRQVDFEYPLALAKAARQRGAKHFLLVSAIGADSDSLFFYNRVKGDIEAAIVSLGFPTVTIARPSLLLGERAETRIGERVGKVLGVIAPPRWKPVHGAHVARALVDAAKRDTPGTRILENADLRAAAL